MLKWLLPAVVVIAVLAPRAEALDPRRTDILTLRLGMDEAAVTDLLEAQGYMAARFTRTQPSCDGKSGSRCLSSLSTRTKDGLLEVDFSAASSAGTASRRVVRISYTFDGKHPGEPEAIETSVLERYGPPTMRTPMTWCDQPDPAGRCQPTGARLILAHGRGPSQVLTLVDRDLPPRP